MIGMIYESRPNVGADASALCLKSGNAVILRGGSDSAHSAQAINAALRHGLAAAGLPEACIQVAPNTDRAYVAAMLAGAGLLDLIIPRGGKSLVERVQREARVPVLAHAEGLNHTYVHAAADPAMARRILANAQDAADRGLRRDRDAADRPGHRAVAAAAARRRPESARLRLPGGCGGEGDRARGCRRRRATRFRHRMAGSMLSVAVVDGVDAALAHIAAHGSEHTDAIVTEDAEIAEKFLRGVDSAVALWNASTQFCDGGEFGFGAEIGIATGRIHARGPVGLEQLTTYRYLVLGSGQVRP